MAQPETRQEQGIEIVRLGADELPLFFDAVNHTVRDDSGLRDRVAIFREGVNFTPKLTIERETGWFMPMIHDLLKQGVSVVVNGIALSRPVAETIGKATGFDPDWIFQQNMYVTPKGVQGFAPHCDPHIVAVAHLYGRKEWTFYDKRYDNPLITDGTKETLGHPPGEPIAEQARITVEPGDIFVIPRGRFHSACALSDVSVHIAIGIGGIRPVDYIWRFAEQAMAQSDMRADMSPEEARRLALDFARGATAEPFALPRNPYAVPPRARAEDCDRSLSFEEALNALSRV